MTTATAPDPDLIGDIISSILDLATEASFDGLIDLVGDALDTFQDLFDSIDDPGERALYEGLVGVVRCTSLGDGFDDAAIRYGLQEVLQVTKTVPSNDRDPTGTVMMSHLINSKPSPERDFITLNIVKMYWTMLTHNPEPREPSPPEFRYRQADGSHNNPDFPDSGRAGMPYGRTVPESRTAPSSRPDPGDIFDSLIGRGENKFEPHPAGFSTFFFAHAALITHDIFHTDPYNNEINNASSYLDLAPLYGNNQDEQNTIRTFVNGEVKRDSFVDKRILGLPPAVSVMVIMYSRFHNYAARTLAAINEDGRFSLPANPDAVAVKKRDEDLFQVARLVTNGLYVNVSVNDYLRAIYNVNQTTSTWGLGPRVETPIIAGSNAPIIPRGVGNTVSREFNLLYRFHSVQSEREAACVTKTITDMFGDADVPNLSGREFFTGLGKWMNSIPNEPLDRVVPGLVRNKDNSYNDADLTAILSEAIDDAAGSFGTNHVPRVLRALEKEAILLARKWNVPTLNEFRAFCNLTSLDKFEDINPDPTVAAKLAKLYKSPNDVELYAGLNAEETKPLMSPAMGICAPYTVMSVILGDAVTMIRGDRYMTTDYKPEILTSWGYNEVACDKEILGGSKIYHLILAAFPNSVRFNSTYAMQPFYTSAASVTIFDRLETANLFNFATPVDVKPPIVLSAYATVAQVLGDQTTYSVPQSGYLPTYMPDDPAAQEAQWTLIKSSLAEEGGVQLVSNFAEQIMLTLLEERRALVEGTKNQYQVDIVKDIGNIVALQFAAVISYLPLEFELISGGTYAEKDLAAVFTNLLEYSTYNFEPTKTWGLRGSLATAMPALNTTVTERVKLLTGTTAETAPGVSGSAIHTFGANFTRSLLRQETDVAVTSDILVGNGYSVLSTVGLVFAQVIDFYLRPENKSHWDQIVLLSAKNRPAAGREADDTNLTLYILEGARLTSTATPVRTFAPTDGKPITLVVDQAGTKVTVNKGDQFICSTDANIDPAAFLNPTKVDLTRSAELYRIFGSAPRERVGREIGIVCLLKMLRTVAALPNLRRAPGETGQLRLVTRPGGLKQYMTPDSSAFTSFPTTMMLYFDQNPVVEVR
ncbi:hypothetical protein Q9L58_007819 [Maublancomyces gigas]|uniref:Heme peroxidase n=1 Tax=Discina gigas TaxID=1032678 RepID=A0ABR3GCH6_9PEZI